jgi:hypothetical protein
VDKWGGDPAQIDDVLDTLRNTGLNLTPADETSLELYYWRHLYGVLLDRRDRKDSPYKEMLAWIKSQLAQYGDKTPPQGEELMLWRQAWSMVYGKPMVDDVVSEQKFLPKYAHIRTQDQSTEYGRPYWLRPDATVAELKEWSNGRLIQHRLHDKTDIASIMASGGLYPTEERTRVLGKWKGGTSSEADQGNGSSPFVFCRQTLDSGDIYMWPTVWRRSTNYSNYTDSWGKISARKQDSYFNIEHSMSHNASMSWLDNNELMVKTNVSVLDDIGYILFYSDEARDKAITYLKSFGVTEIHGIPITKLFLTHDASTAQKREARDLVWAKAFEEEQAHKKKLAMAA